MVLIKFILLIAIFIASTFLGIRISRKYSTRVNELKGFQSALNIFEEKIKFTYEPIPDVFQEISQNIKGNIGQIFENASDDMKIMSAGVAWEKAINESNTKLTKEDKDRAAMMCNEALNANVAQMILPLNLLELENFGPIIENVVKKGLPEIQREILFLRVREKRKNRGNL